MKDIFAELESLVWILSNLQGDPTFNSRKWLQETLPKFKTARNCIENPLEKASYRSCLATLQHAYDSAFYELMV